jgi:hypothetical protein
VKVCQTSLTSSYDFKLNSTTPIKQLSNKADLLLPDLSTLAEFIVVCVCSSILLTQLVDRQLNQNHADRAVASISRHY